MRKNFFNQILFLASFLIFPIVCVIPSQATENSECQECHSDDSLERAESTGISDKVFVDDHKFKISVHNINGITCVDCHADIEELNWDDDVPHSVSLAAVECQNCHDEEAEAYQNSVHKKAGSKGISIPCSACHGYHYVTYLAPKSIFERVNAFCLKCHNPDNFHDWLPQKSTHFKYVECTVCHAPDSPRYINLRFFDLVSNKFLETSDLVAALDTDIEGFAALLDTDSSGDLSKIEFEDFVLRLRQKGIRGTFHGELISQIEPVIHHVNRGEANRDCKACHTPNSPYFERVVISLTSDDGSIEQLQVERKVLETFHVTHFYVLGGTSVRILDKIGLLLIVGGICVVIAHSSARMLTAPIRRERKKKESQS